ncbi:aminopeptidase N-like [Nylanderia fulva]|uniref:aminopeptidase N-like n=1 Tax=Nylanderia fulva TaxID=613905 RepID=UPI0010FB1329|nr:aminopeptidase N-like [Nylanderia fulva]
MMFLKLSSNVLLFIVVMTTAFSVDENARIKWYNDIHFHNQSCLVPLHQSVHINLMPQHSFYAKSSLEIYINCMVRYITLRLTTHLRVMNVNLQSTNSSLIFNPMINYHYGEDILILDFDNLLELRESNSFLYNPNNLYETFTLNIQYENYNFKLRYYNETKLFQTIFREDGDLFRVLFTNLNQPRESRHLFPCFEETKFRTTFDISITHQPFYDVLSNMAIKKYIDISKYERRTIFKTTFPMSPNDVAFVIFEKLKLVPNSTNNAINMWCRSNFIPYITLAEQVAGRVSRVLNSLSNKALPKLDFIILPNLERKFDETLGLIFQKESNYAYNEEFDPPAIKTMVIQSVSHDITHHWFRNLFNTPCPFQHFLKEGFFMFLETYIIDKALPDSRMMDLFIVQIQQEVFHLNDHFSIKYFIEYTSCVTKTDSINFPFSRIIGAVMWRMFKKVLISNTFQTSIEIYLVMRYTYYNRKILYDVRDIMQAVINNHIINNPEEYSTEYYRNIKKIMDIWIMQNRCTVLNVTRDYSKYAKCSCVTISKELYNDLDQEYFIPVTYTNEKNINFDATSPNIKYCLTQSHPEIKIEIDYNSNWIIVNLQQTGFYRVNYDSENWWRLAVYLNSENYKKIHVLNRAQIIDDAFYMAKTERLNFSIFWELASYLKREKDYVAWYPMIKIFEYMANMFPYTKLSENRELLKEVHVTKLFKQIDTEMYNLTVPTNNNLDKCLKQELARWQCIIGNPICLHMTKQQLKTYMQSYIKKNKNFQLSGQQYWAFCNGLKTVNSTEWSEIWSAAPGIYKNRINYEMLMLHTCVEDPSSVFNILKQCHLLDETLLKKNSKDKERLRAQVAHVFLYIFARHSKIVLQNFLFNKDFFKLRQMNMLAIFIVVINNVYSQSQINQIYKYEFMGYMKNMNYLHTRIVAKAEQRLGKILGDMKYFQSVLHQK